MNQPVIDPAAPARLRRLGGDKLLREMVQLFLQLGPGRMEAARSPDLQVAERGVHSLKSSAGNLGATHLQALAGAVEEAAARQDMSAVSAALPALERAYEAAEAELKQLLTELST